MGWQKAAAYTSGHLAESPKAKAVFAVRLDPAAYGSDINHDFAVHLIAQRAKFAPHFAGGDPVPEDAPACPECGAPMRLRHGPYGEFWGCSAHPTCKGRRPV